MTTAYRWFRYVRHHDREQAEAEGWRFSADLDGHHGYYSILMEWPTMSIAPPTRSASVPTPGERFEEAIKAYETARASGVAVEIGFARVQLADVAWNLAQAIIEGLRLSQNQPRQ